MPTIAWLLVGMIVGLAASALDQAGSPGVVVDIVLGICGSVAADALFRAAQGPVSRTDYLGLAVAAGSAAVVLAVAHGVVRLRRNRR